MFFKFMNRGRKAENPNAVTEAMREIYHCDERRDRNQPNRAGAITNKALNGAARNDGVPDEPGSGRDSLTKLKAVARGQQSRQQNQDHWFAKPADVPVGLAGAAEAENSGGPSVPEAERLKAIEALLRMGIDHFSVKQD